MARRKKRRRLKRLTITQQFNRYATGLKFYGESIPTKKRATTNQLNELKKYYQKIRKQLKAEGNIDLPSIAQAYKYVKEQETATTRPANIEPLPYTEETLNLSTYQYPIIDEFHQVIADAIEEVNQAYGGGKLSNQFTQSLTEIEEKFAQVVDKYDNEYLANWLAESDEFEALKNNNYHSYDETGQAIGGMIDSLDAMLNMASDNTADFIAPTNIKFDV